MKIIEVTERTPLLILQLSEVWEKSVKATHLFLSDDEINEIKNYVPQAISEVSSLIVVTNDIELPIGFMGIDNHKLEMLFIAPEYIGKEIGKALIEYGFEHFDVNEVCVNEQNPSALGFYQHMGFHAYKRSDLDEQGRTYPILYMRLQVNTI